MFCGERSALADLPLLSPTLPAASTAPLIAPSAAPPAAPITTSLIASAALATIPLPDDDFLAVVLGADAFFAEAVDLEVAGFFAGVADFEAVDLEADDLEADDFEVDALDAAGFFAVSVFPAVEDFFESVPAADFEALDLPPADEEVLPVAAFLPSTVIFTESFLLVVVAIAFSLKVFFTTYARIFTLIICVCQEKFFYDPIFY